MAKAASKTKAKATLTDADIVGEANAVRPTPSSSDGAADAIGHRKSRDLTAPAGFAWLRADQIAADPHNARKDFDAEALGELADSMALKGLLQKPAVRPANDYGIHQLVAGERRWRAWGLLIERGDWAEDHVELCPIIEGDAAFTDEAGLIENLQRKDLKPLEEARGFQRLIEAHGYDTAGIAEKVGFTQRFVQQRVQLLQLKAGDMAALEAGKITIEEARKRIAAYPEPLELTKEERLIMLEVALHLVRSKIGYYWSSAKVDHSVADDPVALALQERGFLRITQCWQTHATELGMGYEFRSGYLQDLCGADDLKPAAEALLLEQRGYPPELNGEYQTPWLNKPFTRSPAALAKAKAEEELKVIRAQEQAEREKQAEAARAVRAEALMRVEAAEALRRQDAGADLAPELTAIAADMAAPLPWSLNTRGDVLAANGVAIFPAPWNSHPTDASRLRLKMMTIAVNAGAGLATPETVDPEKPLDRPAFEAVMAAELQGVYEDEPADRLAARVTRLLDGYLEQEGMAFGADSNLWHAEAAAELAQDLDADDDGDTFGDDDADLSALSSETLAEEDPSPALKALAGIPADAQPVEA